MDKSYKTRVFIIFIIFFLIYMAIAINLFFIQIVQKDFYTKLGKKQYNVTITMQPERAPIFDRTGKNFFAMNKECLSAFVLPREIKKENKIKLKNFWIKIFLRHQKDYQIVARATLCLWVENFLKNK